MSADCIALRFALRHVECPTPSAKLVLLAIIDLGDEDYTQATLASHTGFSLRQIGTLLKALADAELISRERRGGVGQGRLPDRYAVNAKKLRIAESPNAQILLSDDPADCALPIADCLEPETPRAASFRQYQPEAVEKPPYDNNSTPPSSNPEKTVDMFGGGVGEIAKPKPIAKTAKADPKRGSRIPPNWRPEPDDLAFAATQGFVNGACDKLAGEFVDFWLGVSGAKGVKLDWSATWRNNVRRKAEFRDAAAPPAKRAAGQFIFQGRD